MSPTRRYRAGVSIQSCARPSLCVLCVIAVLAMSFGVDALKISLGHSTVVVESDSEYSEKPLASATTPESTLPLADADEKATTEDAAAESDVADTPKNVSERKAEEEQDNESDEFMCPIYFTYIEKEEDRVQLKDDLVKKEKLNLENYNPPWYNKHALFEHYRTNKRGRVVRNPSDNMPLDYWIAVDTQGRDVSLFMGAEAILQKTSGGGYVAQPNWNGNGTHESEWREMTPEQRQQYRRRAYQQQRQQYRQLRRRSLLHAARDTTADFIKEIIAFTLCGVWVALCLAGACELFGLCCEFTPFYRAGCNDGMSEDEGMMGGEGDGPDV